jgi:hypothetical protein
MYFLLLAIHHIHYDFITMITNFFEKNQTLEAYNIIYKKFKFIQKRPTT